MHDSRPWAEQWALDNSPTWRCRCGRNLWTRQAVITHKGVHELEHVYRLFPRFKLRRHPMLARRLEFLKRNGSTVEALREMLYLEKTGAR